MNAFALIVAQSRKDPDADLLLRRIQYGSDEERDQALLDLVERARRSSDPDDWNAAGIGFHHAGQHDQAARIFEALVQRYPQTDVYRLNLATSYSQTEQIELCQNHLRQLAEHGSTEQFRQLGREQLEGYERFVGFTEEDRKLRELQIRALRQAIQGPERSSEDFIALAKLLILRSKFEPEGDSLAEATLVVEQAQEAFPQEASVLEMLVACYLRRDVHNRLPGVLAQLEKISPDSAALELLATQDDEKARAFSQNIHNRSTELMRAASSGDTSVREAALQDLSKIVAMYPDNSDYRLQYAFALMGTGRTEAALHEAQRLAREPIDSHGFHFNLGQIFWICGDPVQGRHHLDLALHYAQDEQERQDVRDRLTDLGGQ